MITLLNTSAPPTTNQFQQAGFGDDTFFLYSLVAKAVVKDQISIMSNSQHL